MYVCVCHAVNDRAIDEAAECGARTMRELRLATGCSGTCGKCATAAKERLDAHHAHQRASATVTPITLQNTA